MKKTFFLFILIGHFAEAKDKNFPDYLEIRPVVFSLSMVMMHDVVNPPAASRYYAYCMAGAYEIVAQNEKATIPLKQVVRNYPTFTITYHKKYDYKIAALYCILESGRLMLPSGYRLQEDQDKFIANLKKNKISKAIIDSSIAVAVEIAAQIVSWSKTDNYFKLSTMVRYTPVKGEANWYPTPPGYMEAIEPNWRIIRTMVLDSAGQFKPLPFAAFSTDSTSEFYRLAREVYDLSKHTDKEQLEIAGFWDCNPFAIASAGHMMLGFKKMSPGAHWMNITGIVCKKAKCSFEKGIAAHTLVGIALMDAFISCWDEKYRSNRIRPETFINRHIDARWQPVLQTPPFPEYASGHSVISAAAAEVLTYFFGDKFSFTDDSETMFELAPRSFKSFRQAAAEAAVSRLYGGIHYRDAIDNGIAEGKSIGELVVEKLMNAKGGM